MADAPVAPAAAAPPPAPVAAPPPEAPKDPATSTAPGSTKAPSIGDLKAARRGASPPVAPAAETPPADPGKAQQDAGTPKPPEKATATIEMDAGALKQFTTISRELRDSKNRTKELEEKMSGFGKFEKAQSLAKEGKHYDAAREAGIDVDAALAELLGQNNGAPASAGQIDRKLLERLDAIEAKDKARDEESAARKKAEAEDGVKADRSITGKFVNDNATKYPHLAKASEFVDMAFEDYRNNRKTLETESGKALTGEEEARLMVSALEVHEEKWAKKLGAQATAPAETPQAGLDAAVRSGVRQPATQVPKTVTFEQLKAERAAKRIAARRA